MWGCGLNSYVLNLGVHKRRRISWTSEWVSANDGRFFCSEWAGVSSPLLVILFPRKFSGNLCKNKVNLWTILRRGVVQRSADKTSHIPGPLNPDEMSFTSKFLGQWLHRRLDGPYSHSVIELQPPSSHLLIFQEHNKGLKTQEVQLYSAQRRNDEPDYQMLSKGHSHTAEAAVNL
jgi:hypothetical protein